MKRIALIKPSALGDIVHAMPVLSAVRDHFPQAHITWIVNAGFASLLDGHPDLNAVFPFDRGAFQGIRSGMIYALKLMNDLRRQRFDMVLDLQGLARTGLMTAATGAPIRVGLANSREGSRFAYNRLVPVPEADRLHAVDRYWKMVEFLGAGHHRRRCVVPVNTWQLQDVQRELEPFPRPWMVVAVGAKWLTKRWPTRHFATLLKQAQAEFGGTVIPVGSADDKPLSLELLNQISAAKLDQTGRTPLPRLAALLKLADVMIANDTGPLHLAAALGTPCVAPYTCTKIALHGPYGQFHRAVATTVRCAGSYLKQCPNQFACFENLTPDQLWPLLREVLRECPPPRPRIPLN